MSWISERHLVSAISNAGGFGVIACGAMSPELLDTEIAETKARTERPFGVNLITMHPQLVRADRRLREASGRPCRAGRRPSAGRRDRPDQDERRQADGLRARARAGEEIDALRRRRAGDRRAWRRAATSVRSRPRCWRRKSCPDVSKDIPVFVAGGIGRGEAIAAYLEMGAVGVQLGTRFVCADESIAHRTSRRRSSAPPRAMRSPACRSIRGCR